MTSLELQQPWRQAISTETAGRVVDFATAVVTFIDEGGYPFSLRCRVEPEGEEGLIRLQLPPAIPVVPGPAGLLCHSHDEEMWNQQSFTARGAIHREGDAWVFSPESHTEGLGQGGLPRMIELMLTGRRRADLYLKARGLPRPEVPWKDLQAIKRQVFGRGNAALHQASGLYLITAALGTWVAIRDDLRGRPFGVSSGLAPEWDFIVGLGTALSAPLILLVALIMLNGLVWWGGKAGRKAAGWLAVLGSGFLVGMLAEPITWSVLSPSGFDLLLAGIVALNLVLPPAIVLLALRPQRGSLQERRARVASPTTH